MLSVKTVNLTFAQSGRAVTFIVWGDVRDFETFDEADTVARAMALGEYGSQPGEYINMR